MWWLATPPLPPRLKTSCWSSIWSHSPTSHGRFGTSMGAAWPSYTTGSYATGKSWPTRATLSGISIWTFPHGKWRASSFSSRILRQPSSETPRPSRTPRSRKSRWPSRESWTSCAVRAWGLISFDKRLGSTSLAGRSHIPRWPWSRRISSWPTYPWGSFLPWSIASGWTSAPLTMTSSTVAGAGLRIPQKVSWSRSRKKQSRPVHWTSTSMSSWMSSWTLKMAALSQHFIELCSLPTSPHSAITCGQTGCGKTVFALNFLEGHLHGVFHHAVILCPTIKHNKNYQNPPWIWADP